MHTYGWKGEARNEELPRSEPSTEETQVLFHHNGDYSGNVKVVLPTRVGNPQTHHFTDPDGIDQHTAELNVPFEAIKGLVLQYLQGELIGALEDMNDKELERLFIGIE